MMMMMILKICVFVTKPASDKCHVENECEYTFRDVRHMIRGPWTDGAKRKQQLYGTPLRSDTVMYSAHIELKQ